MIMKNSQIRLSWLFLFLAILIGGYIRLSPVLTSEFPINDGGMFYTMTRELQVNHFRLPEITSYNGLNIPYAYPPLGFYLAGFIQLIFGWPLIDIFRILPAVLSTITIPIFYLLAGEFIKNDLQLSLAILIFSLIPASFDWLIMGGGITRSTGFLFSLFTLYYLYKTFTSKRIINVFLTSFFASLTILSHPEIALHTAFSGFVFFIFLEKNSKGIIKSLFICLLILIFTGPWLLDILKSHGLTPFLSAGSTGNYGILPFFDLIIFNFTHEIGITSISFLALIGSLILVSRRQLFLPIWIIVIFFSEPRSAALFLVPVLAICASLAFVEVLSFFTPPTNSKNEIQDQINIKKIELKLFSKITIGILLTQWIISAYSVASIEISSTTIQKDDINALLWVSKNTLPGSRFIILTGEQPFTDPVAEWFPALTYRISINTVQGHEWDDSVNFYDFLDSSKNVQDCYFQDINCLVYWSSESGFSFDYIYVSKSDEQSYRPEISKAGIVSSIQNSKLFKSVYESTEVSIFQATK